VANLKDNAKKVTLDVVTTNGRIVPVAYCFTPQKGHEASLSEIISLENLQDGEGIRELVIPSVLNCNGEDYNITGIAKDVFCIETSEFGEPIICPDAVIATKEHPIDRLVISEGITAIEPNAFSRVFAGTVVWPHSCDTIESNTFYQARIADFEGMEDVVCIKSGAFHANTVLESFAWPVNCKAIPYTCFRGCLNLKSITGIENVTSVGKVAFAFCGFEEFDWPENCCEIPNFCFDYCLSLTTLNIKGPMIAINEGAIQRTGIKKLDLSGTIQCEINPNFAKGRKVEVILPFYQT
jgi:hypothetical protein